MEETARLPKRVLGRSGLEVSRLGLAAIAFHDGMPKRSALRPEDVERAFYELGVSTFFASWQMGPLCEGLRRLIKAGHRDELVIVTAGGIPTGWGVRRAWEKNARVLGTDRIDVWLLGWVRAHWHVTGKTWPAMRKLKEEGKVRALGYSCHDRKLALSMARELEPDVMMLRYNAAHRGAEHQIFSELPGERPGIISYTATRWGRLLRPLPEEGFPSPMAAPECYRFVLGHPSVDVALCAADSFDELRDDVAGVLAGPLEAARLEEVRRFGDAVHRTARGGARFMFRQGN